MGLLKPHSAYVRMMRMTEVDFTAFTVWDVQWRLDDSRSENNVPTRKQSVHKDISRDSVHSKTRPYMSAADTVVRTPREKLVNGG